jgi:hypothetical protein
MEEIGRSAGRMVAIGRSALMGCMAALMLSESGGDYGYQNNDEPGATVAGWPVGE